MVHPYAIQLRAHRLLLDARNLQDDLTDMACPHGKAPRAAAAVTAAACIRLHDELKLWVKELEHAPKSHPA